MTATTITAIYAAFVASAGLVWQVFAWRRTQSTRVRVDLNNAWLTGLSTLPYVAMIQVKNLGQHAVKVTSAGFDMQDGSGRKVLIMSPPPGATVPGIINPRDSGVTWIDVRELLRVGMDVARPMVVWADLATGETVRSNPTTLVSVDASRHEAAA